DDLEAVGPGVAGHGALAGAIELSQVVNSVAVIGVVVGPDYRFDFADVGVEELLPEVGPGVDENAGFAPGYEDRHSAAAVPGVRRIALSPVVADPGNARRGAAAEDPDLHHSPTLANRDRKFEAVLCATSAVEIPRRTPKKRAVSAT